MCTVVKIVDHRAHFIRLPLHLRHRLRGSGGDVSPAQTRLPSTKTAHFMDGRIIFLFPSTKRAYFLI